MAFYPLGISLSGAPVLVFGGSPSVHEVLLRLLESGAEITLVASLVCREIEELKVAYGRRLGIVKCSVAEFLADHNVGAYRLVFACNHQFDLNMSVVSACKLAETPVAVPSCPEKSTFVVPTAIKRGNVCISVASDGLCPPLEAALMSRIEELLVAEFDRYSIFLSEYRERLERALKVGQSEHNQLVRMLTASPELSSALARKNFEEALRLVDNFLGELFNDSSDPENSDENSQGADVASNLKEVP